MPQSDTKKVQTLINRAGKAAIEVRERVAELKALRTLFNSANPDVTGTPLEGNTAILSNAINSLDTEISKAVWTGLIAEIQPTHSEEGFK